MYEWHGRLMIEAGLAKGYNCKKAQRLGLVTKPSEREGGGGEIGKPLDGSRSGFESEFTSRKRTKQSEARENHGHRRLSAPITSQTLQETKPKRPSNQLAMNDHQSNTGEMILTTFKTQNQWKL
ncbi:hypothetical protein PVK06_028376 [Gossypium arboreum]|uniref:Uncharacterized protein n=1 Tax=Gossypium arboreum TaxID=29729 RepID=A0ABR0P386_GOSAR|nr:hypothetical protein PVK06_028376 [Gossypium arboreum]